MKGKKRVGKNCTETRFCYAPLFDMVRKRKESKHYLELYTKLRSVLVTAVKINREFKLDRRGVKELENHIEFYSEIPKTTWESES